METLKREAVDRAKQEVHQQPADARDTLSYDESEAMQKRRKRKEKRKIL